MKATDEIVLINRLLKVADDPVIQRAGLDSVVGIGGNEDRWDGMTRLDEALVEIYAGHHGHVDIRDQAIRIREMG
jgi:hypothetical protein